MSPQHPATVAACTTCLAGFGFDPIVSGLISALGVYLAHHVGVWALPRVRALVEKVVKRG